MLKEYEIVKKYMQDNKIKFSGDSKRVDVECKKINRKLQFQFKKDVIIVKVDYFLKKNDDSEWVSMADGRAFSSEDVIAVIERYAK